MAHDLPVQLSLFEYKSDARFHRIHVTGDKKPAPYHCTIMGPKVRMTVRRWLKTEKAFAGFRRLDQVTMGSKKERVVCLRVELPPRDLQAAESRFPKNYVVLWGTMLEGP